MRGAVFLPRATLPVLIKSREMTNALKGLVGLRKRERVAGPREAR